MLVCLAFLAMSQADFDAKRLERVPLVGGLTDAMGMDALADGTVDDAGEGAAATAHGDGTLSTVPPGDEASDRFTYDPADPVPTLGGNNLIIDMGVKDQRPVEERPDVLVFETPPLREDVAIAGPVTVKLYISSNCIDTDFTAKLIDVYPPNEDYPRGYALNLCDGILRCRYRNSWGQATLMTPGTVYEITIEPFATCNLFKAGHRIRLDVSSSN